MSGRRGSGSFGSGRTAGYAIGEGRTSPWLEAIAGIRGDHVPGWAPSPCRLPGPVTRYGADGRDRRARAALRRAIRAPRRRVDGGDPNDGWTARCSTGVKHGGTSVAQTREFAETPMGGVLFSIFSISHTVKTKPADTGSLYANAFYFVEPPAGVRCGDGPAHNACTRSE